MAGTLQDLVERINEIAGPGFVGLLHDPELGPLLLRAADPTQGFSPQRFQSELYKTNWWRRQSESQRNWALKTLVDPGEANRIRGDIATQIRMQAQRMGVAMSNAEVKYATEVAAQRGISSGTDPYIVNTIMGISHHPGRVGPGQIKTTVDQLNAYARGEYYKQYSTTTLTKWADWITQGVKTLQDFQSAVHVEASRSMPWLKNEFQSGATLHDLVGPLQQVVATELGLASPDQVDVMNDVRWKPLLGVRDTKGHMVLPTQQDAMVMARRQPEWQKTSNGRQLIAGQANNFLKLFGARA